MRTKGVVRILSINAQKRGQCITFHEKRHDHKLNDNVLLMEMIVDLNIPSRKDFFLALLVPKRASFGRHD